MNNKVALAPIVVCAALLAGCGSDDSSDAPTSTVAAASQTTTSTSESTTIDSVVADLRSAVPQISKVIVITEDNDPNNLVGRPNGYVAATVIEDSRVKCSEGQKIGVSCGAMVEEWADTASAQRRSDQIQEYKRSMPILGQEYNHVEGPFLLRVSGDLKPSQAKKYETAFDK
ncbi:hypothetical protein nbrc107696_24010 [Gordonia spumicola]|uniref:Lipoprotein n=1 Tax=Gordonia spumicola TaxID=589161 RepID=A0A7I9V9G1_9ACTN|nr:hypothetical protein [Gordonia spumicola]GEE01955.1 hypothetical protein nbrc107696_24010 [Gordonia spumicola]